jgi:fructosamine-3-kinase
VTAPLDLTVRVADALGAAVLAAARLGGGDVAEAYRMVLDDGRTVFAKTHRDPPPHFFETEASGLDWLRDADAIAVPEVLAVDSAMLVLEWIDEGRAASATETSFGRGLAALHRAGAPCFGRDDRMTTGSRRLPNEPCDTWAEFYATNRLLPLVRLATDHAALSPTCLERLERTASRLPEFGAADEPPARLHGDLWAGNRLVDTGGSSWLIDPAAHGGHREFDLAMMQLFGGYGPECFDAYDDEFPLADEWEQRVPLHQLAPLVVHAVKFGGGYAAATERALDALGI